MFYAVRAPKRYQFIVLFSSFKFILIQNEQVKIGSLIPGHTVVLDPARLHVQYFLLTIEVGNPVGHKERTVCPRSSDPFYV